jgi:glycerate dehydrogenase
MKIVLLDAKTLGDDLDLGVFDAFGEVTLYQTTAAEETPGRISDAEIVITNKVVITREMMQNSPKLKLVCIAATGMNNVDLEAAEALGITVKNVAGYSTQSVVQHTFAMALYLLEQMAYYDQSVKNGTWTASRLFTDVSRPFYEIAGKKWGIIGLGSIGREVAKVATAFGAEVCYYSTSGIDRDRTYQRSTLADLLKTCDIISIHAPLNEKTRNLIDRTNLPYIKERGILLNLGRGGIVNETDLAEAMHERTLYTGLDVLEQEPIKADHPLLNIPRPQNLLITPHIAWTSIEARQKLLQGIVENIRSFLQEQK